VQTGLHCHSNKWILAGLFVDSCCFAVRHVEDIPFVRIRPAKATAQEKKFTDMHSQTFASAVCLQWGMAHHHSNILLTLLYNRCVSAVRHVEDIPFERIRPAKATAQQKTLPDTCTRTVLLSSLLSACSAAC
jgi:hypothetical protein